MTGIMTRLRIACLFVAVVAGDYAALMLIDCQLIHFGVAAAVCGGSSVAAGLIAYADDEDARRQHELGRRRRTAVARRRAAVPEHADLQAATVADQQCPLCGACASAPAQSRHDESTAGLGASSDGRATRPGAPGDGKPRLGVTWNRVGWRRTPDDPRVEVSK